MACHSQTLLFLFTEKCGITQVRGMSKMTQKPEKSYRKDSHAFWADQGFVRCTRACHRPWTMTPMFIVNCSFIFIARPVMSQVPGILWLLGDFYLVCKTHAQRNCQTALEVASSSPSLTHSSVLATKRHLAPSKKGIAWHLWQMHRHALPLLFINSNL